MYRGYIQAAPFALALTFKRRAMCYHVHAGFSPYRGNIQAARRGWKAGSRFLIGLGSFDFRQRFDRSCLHARTRVVQPAPSFIKSLATVHFFRATFSGAKLPNFMGTIPKSR
jgi:hypothetical protein